MNKVFNTEQVQEKRGRLTEETIAEVYETDWLASRPVFYHELSGKASYRINEVIDFDNLEFHPEGLANFLSFGYSVLEQTPLRHVKFLPHSSRLTVHTDGRLEIERLIDPVKGWMGRESHEDDVLHLLEKSVNDWEASVEGEIILPTSGGYDSRLLNLLVHDRSRIRSFTYGVSENQADCAEVVYAAEVSEILGTRWERIELGDFLVHLNEWDRVFGLSTHAHGCHQIEFYKKVQERVAGGGEHPLLSGIIGDAWAGSVQIPEIVSVQDVQRLGYSHGMVADPQMSLLAGDRSILEQYYETHRERLRSPLFRVVEAMRFKIVLLSYLFTVPRLYGFNPWSPFLVPEVALSMLTLPAERRRGRVWQKELFERHGLNIESRNLQADYQNAMNPQAMRSPSIKPLDEKLLAQLVEPRYVQWINRHVGQQGKSWDAVWKMTQMPGIRGALYRLNIFQDSSRVKAYFAYLTLKPIENALKKRALALTCEAHS
ncbi:MAG TPA: hypothetical protein VM911_02740 [Pyrinomonadaceae bacterium]|nr:hypothetical protein [Pyrinomonadaceae bacterium]